MHLSAETIVGIIAVAVSLPPVVLGVLKAYRHKMNQHRLPVHQDHWPVIGHINGLKKDLGDILDCLLTRDVIGEAQANGPGTSLARPAPALLRQPRSLPMPAATSAPPTRHPTW